MRSPYPREVQHHGEDLGVVAGVGPGRADRQGHPVAIDQEMIDAAGAAMPELPAQRAARLRRDLELSAESAQRVTLPCVANGSLAANAERHYYRFSAKRGERLVFDLKAFRFDSTAGRLAETPKSQSAIEFTYPGPTPAVSSNGRRDGIVWVVQADAYVDGGSAVLRAFDAWDLSRELYSSDQALARDDPGRAVKFTVPTVVNGKVYVAAQDRVSVYGLLDLR